MTKLFKTLLVAGVLSATSLAAFSQGSSAMGGYHDGHRMHQRDPAKMQAKVEKHLADLKAKLKITAAQEGAWNTFASAMKPPTAPMNKAARPNKDELAKLPMPERIDAIRKLRKDHMDAQTSRMDTYENAAKALYAVLTPEQQKIADAEHAKRLGMHFGQGRHGGRGDHDRS
jgi:Spy/CpxP family protein refolding chaperone